MAKPPGVFKASNGTWYFKVRTHRSADGGWKQVTRRGFATAGDARIARDRLLSETEHLRGSEGQRIDHELTVAELVARYLDTTEVMGRLGPKTLFDYRSYAKNYISPHLGEVRANDLAPKDVVDWQVHLARAGAVRRAGGLSSNTIRLARAPLSGAYQFGIENGLVGRNPVHDAKPPAKT